MTDTDNLDIFLLTTEKFAYSLCLSLNSTSRRLLNKYITVLAMFEGEEDEINGFFERHDEAGHFRFGQCNRVAVADLFDPKWNNRTT